MDREKSNQEFRKDDFVISTDTAKLDLNFIHGFLQQIYWAENIPREIVNVSIKHSLCFGLYCQSRQIGFARVVSDFSTIAYVTDGFILEEYAHLSGWFMTCLLSYPALHGMRRWLLAQKDGLYAHVKFTSIKNSDQFLEVYKTKVTV